MDLVPARHEVARLLARANGILLSDIYLACQDPELSQTIGYTNISPVQLFAGIGIDPERLYAQAAGSTFPRKAFWRAIHELQVLDSSEWIIETGNTATLVAAPGFWALGPYERRGWVPCWHRLSSVEGIRIPYDKLTTILYRGQELDDVNSCQVPNNVSPLVEYEPFSNPSCTELNPLPVVLMRVADWGKEQHSIIFEIPT
ncbi:hypothetical protein PCH_Pc20g13060 [Penicillium rubens Wisconsin 54-1255]|uniref:Uncharacterized protein n=1 Tax=Penicillium rubens (strain ATCC 28089 / DSM 1075 / NRRL 1951 / Wisconsin 54-1255) TaxID=500485 RepID=B6HGP4_PENRW|nr:hypothetical protein PCH_Pc20g13060 [Penicillium rubens Wisconsin 54-1255]